MEKVLSGKPVAAALNKAAKRILAEHPMEPKMLLIQVGSEAASAYYVQSILKNAAKFGCKAELMSLPDDSGQDYLLKQIQRANTDPYVHGIMIQKPLPKSFDESLINLSVNPDKDLDALNPINLGRIMAETEGFLPCTPAAVIYSLKYYGIDPVGKNTVILGRSNVVGKPLANILLWKKLNATVTVCHSRTANLADICRNADILISAIGIPHFVKADMVKENAVLIDVGINEITGAEGKAIYVGDMDYKALYDKALALTPVPGGIGRITTSLLYLNLIKAALIAKGINKSVDEYIDLVFVENT
ncbi:MAG: bifunctional 5,10-methylenetetrahydrofolate dehydrogenase/5,10-methenyltetrahydrofolate cyclohydrolase [Candidatus Cloacimonetes bacterium]|nr:bifunctional 5,10-methylenetetrahydrofolate dehydrogenase/5,10-methenyltetrahydrofolate cyclohydrolase [Candidatus Cloacimonadota bacterium]